MKKFMADWKNPALLGAALVVVLLLVLIGIQRGRSVNARLVSVGNESITRADFLTRLKIIGANEILSEMAITNLLAAYARQKDITATEAELRQFDDYNAIRAAVSEKTLDEYVSDLGVTMEQWRNYNAEQILSTKLIVPEDDIKTAVSMYADQYTFPTWYRYRRFVIMEKDKAKQAVELLKKPEGAAEVAQFSISEPGARPDGIRFYIELPGMPANDYPDVITALKSLKAGQVSQPFQLPAQDGPKPWVVVQALDVHPQEKPTVKNRGVLIAKERLLDGNPKYGQRQQEFLTDAFQKIDVTFSPAIKDFARAYEQLSDLKTKSVYIPPASGMPLPDMSDTAPAPQGPLPAPSGQ